MKIAKHLRTILFPSVPKRLVFAVLWVVAVGAQIQAYAVVDDLPDPPPKPPLVDLVRPLPLWPLGLLLLSPLLG